MRTNNDTWDITTSVGSTALFVAAARALEANKADPLVVDPYAELFCRAVGGEWAELLDGKAPDHKLSSEFGDHFVNFQAARTKFFDTYFYAAADAGVRQIVIPAAGLDSRAYRLAWPNATVVFELDQPEVLEFKRQVLADMGTHRLPNAARSRSICVTTGHMRCWSRASTRRAPSAWLAEGLLIYLPAAAQHAPLHRHRRLGPRVATCGRGSRADGRVGPRRRPAPRSAPRATRASSSA